MATDFSRTLSLLRQETGVSQRKAAAALGVSQALLSHYENGIREPGLAFVSRVAATTTGVRRIICWAQLQPGWVDHRRRRSQPTPPTGEKGR